jgi:hypothetical protein
MCAPSLESPGERINPSDAQLVKPQCYPGASDFVRAGTIEYDVAVARNLLVSVLELLGKHVYSARNFHTIGLEMERVAEINYNDLLASLKLPHQFLWRDPSDAELADETLAFDVLPSNVDSQQDPKQYTRPEAPRRRANIAMSSSCALKR